LLSVARSKTFHLLLNFCKLFDVNSAPCRPQNSTHNSLKVMSGFNSHKLHSQPSINIIIDDTRYQERRLVVITTFVFEHIHRFYRSTRKKYRINFYEINSRRK